VIEFAREVPVVLLVLFELSGWVEPVPVYDATFPFVPFRSIVKLPAAALARTYTCIQTELTPRCWVSTKLIAVPFHVAPGGVEDVETTMATRVIFEPVAVKVAELATEAALSNAIAIRFYARLPSQEEPKQNPIRTFLSSK
jgi:hypothetical protein